MWDSYRWWKRGTDETQKGIPLLLGFLFISRLRGSQHIYVNKGQNTKEGAISISAQENIESTKNSNIQEVIVTVKDTGSGI